MPLCSHIKLRYFVHMTLLNRWGRPQQQEQIQFLILASIAAAGMKSCRLWSRMKS